MLKGDGTMKTKIIAGLLMVTLLSFPITPRTYADVNGWEAAGLVLAGAVGYAIISDVAENHSGPRHFYGQPIYEPAPRVRVYQTRPMRQWVPGHYETRMERVWVEGYYEKVWVPPVTRRMWVRHRNGGGYWRDAVVEPGYFENVWREGYWANQETQVWIEGFWSYE
jgi:hypothetical protein